MLIYEGVLTEKRILFCGGLDHSAEEILDYCFACVSLVSPPLVGVLCMLHPYATLSNLKFTDEQGYIAGVTNPIFKQNPKLFDLCAEIDIAKLQVSRNHSDNLSTYENEKYYQLDIDFIRPIMARVQTNSINDEDIRKCFESYTQVILDLAFGLESGRPDMMHDSERISDVMSARVKRFQRTTLYQIQKAFMCFKDMEMRDNISLSLIESLIRRLRLSRDIKEPELLTIFQQIYRFLQDEDSVLKFLSLLPLSRDGVLTIAQGLFHPSPDIERICT